MTQVTHEEARKLINLAVDEGLGLNARPALDDHLRDCAECRAYASGLKEVEHLLRKIKHSQIPSPAPLDIAKIMGRVARPSFGIFGSPSFARAAAMAVAVIVVAASLWQFSISGTMPPAATPYTIAPIPTPSTYLTVTNTNSDFSNCVSVIYQTQAGDTLEDIARQFSISKELLMEFNGMTNEKIAPSMQIKIPRCARTPTTTSGTPDGTTTITPPFNSITQTPG